MELPQVKEDRTHTFVAVAFVDDLPLSLVVPLLPDAKVNVHELRATLEGGEVFAFSFGALVFHDVEPGARDAFMNRLRERHPRLVPDVIREDFTVLEVPGCKVGLAEGRLLVDQLGTTRAAVVALIVAQSAAMETYERIVDNLFARTRELLGRLEERGLVPMRTRPLHRFIGEAVGRRSEVISTLHLLDKPDATWDDPAMDRIYDDLRGEFDLGDRFDALNSKLRAVQEALELLLGVARDRRLVALEVAIVALILAEIVFTVVRGMAG